jgi:hypothetical protein
MDSVQSDADQEASRDAQEFAADVKRGARRVRSAVRKGADEVVEAVRPSFGAQIGDAFRSLATDPAESPRLFADVVRDHPIAALSTAAIAAIALQRLLTRR